MSHTNHKHKGKQDPAYSFCGDCHRPQNFHGICPDCQRLREAMTPEPEPETTPETPPKARGPETLPPPLTVPVSAFFKLDWGRFVQ